jgi:REP element-mobilizing transposase RayT
MNNKKDINLPNRQSIRLKGYDYSQEGLYFITICCQDRVHLFGEISEGEMVLNDAGKMIEKWYQELENKYPDKICHQMVVMPNHFHCIIENVPNNNNNNNNHVSGDHVGMPLRGRPVMYGMENKIYNAIIGDAIGWFKTMTTNAYIHGVKTQKWKRFNKRLWQRNYWEHIIRDEQSFDRISVYIADNPKNWKADKFMMD